MSMFNIRYSAAEEYKSTACNLHTLLSPLHFQVMVFDADSLTVQELVSYQFDNDSSITQDRQLKNLFETEDLFQKRFKTISAWSFSAYSALCPDELFRQTESEQWARLYFPEKEVEHRLVRNSSVLGNQARLMYLSSAVYERLIDNYVSGVKVKPIQTRTIDYVLSKDTSGNEYSVYIFIYGHHFEVLVKTDTTFIFYNVFSYTTEADFIFYVMHVLEALNMDPTKIQIHLAGDIDSSSKLYGGMLRYVREVILLERPKALRYPSDIQAAASSFYFPLFLTGL